MKVSAILKGRVDKDGRQSVHIRVNNKERRTFKATQIKVTDKQFSKGKVINHPNAADYNSKIKKLIIEEEHRLIHAPKPKAKNVNFYEYVENWFHQMESTGQRGEGTLKNYRSEINMLKEFNPSFNFSDVDKDFLERYRLHCSQIKNKSTTVWRKFKFLHSVFELAKSDELIDKDPFLKFKMPRYKNPEKEYLTKEDIKLIEKANLTSKQRIVATWFLICCFTGFRFGDANRFDRKKHIKSGRLVVVTQKTGDTVSLPISDRVRGYFESLHYRPMGITNQYSNRVLKTIAEKAGIDAHLTYHCSRHTFGVLAAEAGISQEVVAKILGHSSLKSTAIYFKITNPRIDAEIGKLR